jgi:hypothetical protein
MKSMPQTWARAVHAVKVCAQGPRRGIPTRGHCRSLGSADHPWGSSAKSLTMEVTM